jgi:3-dehydroquinate synthetase
MAQEAVLARDLGQLHPSCIGRITRILKAYNLPVEIPKQYLDVPALMKKMGVDKKNMGGKIRYTEITIYSVVHGISARFTHDGGHFFMQVHHPDRGREVLRRAAAHREAYL